MHVHTGRLWSPEFPVGIVNTVTYDGTFRALCLFLTRFCNISASRTRQLLKRSNRRRTESDRWSHFSAGAGIFKKVPTGAEEIFHKLFQDAYQHVDTMTVHVNGQQQTISVSAHENYIYYAHTQPKSHKAAKALRPVSQVRNSSARYAGVPGR